MRHRSSPFALPLSLLVAVGMLACSSADDDSSEFRADLPQLEGLEIHEAFETVGPNQPIEILEGELFSYNGTIYGFGVESIGAPIGLEDIGNRTLHSLVEGDDLMFEVDGELIAVRLVGEAQEGGLYFISAQSGGNMLPFDLFGPGSVKWSVVDDLAEALSPDIKYCRWDCNHESDQCIGNNGTRACCHGFWEACYATCIATVGQLSPAYMSGKTFWAPTCGGGGGGGGGSITSLGTTSVTTTSGAEEGVGEEGVGEEGGGDCNGVAEVTDETVTRETDDGGTITCKYSGKVRQVEVNGSCEWETVEGSGTVSDCTSTPGGPGGGGGGGGPGETEPAG